MSGICALFNLNNSPVQQFLVERMMKSLAHRGSDGHGIWVEGNVALGHQMMWITPESLFEKLPAKNTSGSLVITCDARIDNRDDLIPQLSFREKKTSEISDSEIILAAFEKWGEDCVPKLIGDFVFVIWDAKKQKLFCARDPLGVKHFYYYYKPYEVFALASEAKALLALPFVAKEINSTFIGDYLLNNHFDKEITPYKGIKRLPATHALAIELGVMRTWRYWHPDPTFELRLKSDKEYEEAFREKFIEAVRCRVRSAFPVGSFLSGGLDSSSVVCVASRILSQQGKPPLHTFSAVFPSVAQLDPRCDEREYMESVVNSCECQPHFIQADSGSPLDEIDKLQWHADHPLGAANAYLDWLVYKAAHQNGVRVVLSGTDGDSTVSYGYEDLAYFAERGQWFSLIKEAILLNKKMPRPSHSFKRLAWNQGFSHIIPEWMIKAKRIVRPNSKTSRETLKGFRYINSVVNPYFAQNAVLEQRSNDLWNLTYPPGCREIEFRWFDLTKGIFAFLLESLEKLSAAFEVETRYPFFDRRLIEFCISLPPGQRLNGGWTRSIFRRAMDGILPDDVRWRTSKSNISANTQLSLLKYGREQITEVLYNDSSELSEYMDIEALLQIFKEYENAPLKNFNLFLSMISAVCLSNWLRQNQFRKEYSKMTGMLQQNL